MPACSIGRSIRGQHPRVQVETLPGSRQHVAHGADFGLPDRCGGLHVDDGRIVQIDQVVGAIGEEGSVPAGSGEPRGGVGGRDRLRFYGRCGAKSGAVERVEIFLRRSAGAIFR